MSVHITRPNPVLTKLCEITETHPEGKKDSENCEHEYKFFDCIGTLCAHCGIFYGEECLHPDCKIRGCEKHMLVYEAFETKTYGDVIKDMTDDICIVHLGHDGVTEGTDEDVRKLMSFKNLKMVEFCGYYTDDNVEDILYEYLDRVAPIY